MIEFDRITMGNKARELGFVRDTFEKVCRLVNILAFIQKDPLLSNSLALKGGTAINLTIFNLPRLSVDIDLDFTENISREEMITKRKLVFEHINKYMTATGYILSPKTKTYHALDSFVYEYKNAGGMKDNLKIEINYILRCHVLPLEERKVNLPWIEQDLTILSVNSIEIFSSKIVALLNRAAPRDLYDIHSMIGKELFNNQQKLLLKKCTMFYSAIGAERTPKEFVFSNISLISQQQIKSDLLPVLHRGEWFDVKQAHEEVVDYLTELLTPNEQELSFWNSFELKQYCPEKLFEDSSILSRINQHPMALWKCSEVFAK